MQGCLVQVHCKICKRNGSNDDSFLQRFTTGNMFTHHQKSVILDAGGLQGGPQVEHKHLGKSKYSTPAYQSSRACLAVTAVMTDLLCVVVYSDRGCPAAKTATTIRNWTNRAEATHVHNQRSLAAWQAPALAILLYHLWRHQHSLVNAPMAVSWHSHTTRKAPN